MVKNYPNSKYQYYDPQTECNHPQRLVHKVKFLHENINDGADNSFSVARINDDKDGSLAIRWNIAYDQFIDDRCKAGELKCLGFPYSHSYPTWFVLPQGSKVEGNKIIIPLKK